MERKECGDFGWPYQGSNEREKSTKVASNYIRIIKFIRYILPNE